MDGYSAHLNATDDSSAAKAEHWIYDEPQAELYRQPR